MTLAKFVNQCIELGATRPPINQLLQFKMVIFKDFREAKAASDLLYDMDNKARFQIIDNHSHANLQYINPDK